MNRILSLLPVALLLSCAGPTVPSLAPIKAAVTAARSSTTQARDSVSRAQQGTTKAQQSLSTASEKILRLEQLVSNQSEALDLTKDIKIKLTDAQDELSAVQHEHAGTLEFLKKTLGALGTADESIKTKEAELKKVQAKLQECDRTNTKYHRLKFGIIFLVTGLSAGAMFKFGKPLLALGWIGIGVLVAVPAGIFTALLFIL